MQLAAEYSDVGELRRLAELGYPDAVDQLIETAAETGNMDELRRLAEAGNTTAAEQLAELTDE
ncbi:MAG: hypothetical protein H7Y15_10000 [Pseudonocardia sp.]|nr:hypothetical protein [Pseudonocardia sp.]